MRKYQPIWEALKQHGTASLIADTKMHRRIIQAVRKEKTKDRGWKLLELEKGKHWKLYDSAEGKKLTFTLEEYTPITTAIL